MTGTGRVASRSDRQRTGGLDSTRGQANLVALGVALFAVTTATVIGVAVAVFPRRTEKAQLVVTVDG